MKHHGGINILVVLHVVDVIQKLVVHAAHQILVYAVENIQYLIVKILDENIIDLINGYLHISIHLQITNGKTNYTINK